MIGSPLGLYLCLRLPRDSGGRERGITPRSRQPTYKKGAAEASAAPKKRWKLSPEGR